MSRHAARLALAAGLAVGAALAGATPAASPLTRQAPAVLTYRTGDGPAAPPLLVRVRTFAPDLVLEWEHGHQLGACVVSAAELESGSAFLRRMALADGRRLTPRATVFVLSRSVFARLRQDGWARLRIQGHANRLRVIGPAAFPLADRELSALAVLDEQGNRYLFQDCPGFPLLLEFESPHHRETLIGYHTGPDVLFRGPW